MPKKCFVPNCQRKEGIFFSLPRLEKRRKAWFACIGITNNPPRGHGHNFCEDHFELPNDTKNWVEYNMMPNTVLHLKDNIVPHKNLSKHVINKEQEEDPHLRNESEDMQFPTKKSFSTSVDGSRENDSFPSPSKVPRLQHHGESLPSTTVPSSTSISSQSESVVSILFRDLSDSTDEEKQMQETEHAFLAAQRKVTTIELIEHNSRFYLGLEKKLYFLVKFITHWQNINYRDVLITLKKIRLDDVYFRLGLDFGISVATVQRAFLEGVKKIANVMINFIFCPRRSQILNALPLPFRFRYSNVSYIIDCFEVEIAKPSNPIHQSFSWSEYKKCNTAKYLISATPHGFINFVSAGFGGRISDNAIISASGYIDVIKDCSIMADRGFKNVANLLAKKNCILIRPPSVGENILSKQEVKEAKRIAALRIHIERTIVRIREFKMLDSHAKINTKMIVLLDEIVIIACGLINLKGPLIK